MDTSKTSSIKSLLLRAWRERWTDVQWGINIKSVLPRGVSGDVYDLADCILQQALVGPGPNNLFLSYLTHSLSSHVVSYGAVMSSIGRYQSFYKPYCILSLLNLLKSIEKRVGCRGNEEECIALCKAVVNVTHWLYSCVFHSLSKMTELKIQSTSTEHSTIMEKACEILSFFNTSTLVKSLLYTGRFEEPSVFNQLLQKHQELESRINQTQGGVCKELFEAALSLVESVNDFPYKALAKRSPAVDTTQPPFACSVNVLIAIDAILNPSGSIQVCVDQLLLVKRLQNLSTPSLYCEILRASFMGLMESSSSSEDLKWAAFAFLKIPQLLVKLRQSLNAAPNESGNDLELGLQKLLYYTPLLDLTDMKSNCDCLQYLLNEFIKAQLLNETQMQDLLSQRQNESHRHTVSRTEQQTNQTSANLILRAEPTVTSILKTLDSDYSKNQDALLGVLCHMIPGKSFELILSAANATGKLHNFANKLIRFNEYNKQMTGEGGRASQTRALLFDITFLMLCHIAQHYGIETVTSSAETRESFFATWVTECLAEGGKYKSPDTMVAHSDAAKVDLLLAQFTNPEPEFKTSLVKWHEICINAPLAIKEILLAWEYGAVSTDRVKMILDNVKSRMCCLPVCISAWLCNYINMLHHEERLKPMNMIQQFMTPLVGECTIWENLSERSTASSTASTEPLNCYYKERSTLMSSIIKKMLYDLHPPPQAMVKNMGFTTISHGLTVKTPLWDIMENIFTTGHTQGWIDLATTHSLDTLLCVGGPVWFCDTLVRMALKFEHLEDLHRAIDFVFGIFHIDIEQCALAMLTNVIPSYLNKEAKQEMLLEPRGTALARLLVMTIFGALQAKQTASSLGVPRTGKKRTNRDVEMEDVNDPERNRPNKIRRSAVGDIELYDDTPFGIQSSNDESLRNVACEPLNRAIADIMRMLMFIALDPTMSQRTLFPVLFLEQITLCAKEQSQMVLQFMPLGLVLQLIKCLPDAFSYELILATSNFQTPRARKITARALCQLDNHQRFFAN